MKTTKFNTPYTKRPRLLTPLTITKCALCHVLRQPYWPGSLWPNVSLMKKHLDWWSWVGEWGEGGHVILYETPFTTAWLSEPSCFSFFIARSFMGLCRFPPLSPARAWELRLVWMLLSLLLSMRICKTNRSNGLHSWTQNLDPSCEILILFQLILKCCLTKRHIFNNS